MSSTSEASRPAMRMPSTSAALLIEIVILELSPAGFRAAPGPGRAPSAAAAAQARGRTDRALELRGFTGASALRTHRPRDVQPQAPASLRGRQRALRFPGPRPP